MRLEDCISASLFPETLFGDNKYKLDLQSRSPVDFFRSTGIVVHVVKPYKTQPVTQSYANSLLFCISL